MYSVFEKLLQERCVNALAVSKATGISSGTLSDWKNGRIKALKADKLRLIADYFGVSVDYLMTGSDPEGEHITAQERRLLAYYRALSEGNKKIIENTARALKESNENEISAS